MARKLYAHLRNSKGATAIEYGLIVALVVIACVGSMTLLAGRIIVMWNFVSTTVVNA
jgi:pilus assembly protein Flp/PilA